MPVLSYRHAIQLRHELKDTQAKIFTPDEERYAELISRWSEACEKEAVGPPFPEETSGVLNHILYTTLTHL